MALLGAVASLGAVLEDDDLFAPILAQDLASDERVGDDRSTDLRCISVGNQEHALKADGFAWGALEPLDRQLAAELHAILLAAGLDYCVHGFSEALRGRGARAFQGC